MMYKFKNSSENRVKPIPKHKSLMIMLWVMKFYYKITTIETYVY